MKIIATIDNKKSSQEENQNKFENYFDLKENKKIAEEDIYHHYENMEYAYNSYYETYDVVRNETTHDKNNKKQIKRGESSFFYENIN